MDKRPDYQHPNKPDEFFCHLIPTTRPNIVLGFGISDDGSGEHYTSSVNYKQFDGLWMPPRISPRSLTTQSNIE